LAALIKGLNLIQTDIDSLQNILQKRPDTETTSEPAGLAGAFEITQRLKQKNEELKSIEIEQRSIKNKLFVLYSKEIDTLQEKLILCI